MRIPYKGAGIALFYSQDNETYILLGLRSDHPFYKRWSVPGGYFEKKIDKTPLDNAFREFFEETGIPFETFDANYIGKNYFTFPLFYWSTYIYQTKYKIENFKPNEFYELKWINIKDINTLKLRPFTKLEIKTFCRAHH